MENSRGLTRTLGEVDLCRTATGQSCFTVGNSAVVFKIRHEGRLCALRCYTHPARNLATIYGSKLRPAELFVYGDPTHGEWVDVVVDRWIEGQTLHDQITQADAAQFAQLAASFDRAAAAWVADDWAHGDLKPENIIVAPDGTLHLIDWDATFLPEFAGMQSGELGTTAFQHPARTAADFDATLDDFAVALLSTALHALALDPSLRDRYGVHDTLLIDPRQLPHDRALCEILALFERHGCAAQYRIARLLLSPTLHLPALAQLLHAATTPPPHEPLELFVEEGFWGYRGTTTQTIYIAPMYNSGFDFSDDLAAVQLGHTWHYIDKNGTTVISCTEYESVKPFRNGHARVLGAAGWCEIDRTGSVYVLEY
ncbi:MAG: WG repeat-containing protein [Alistipes sp.]